MKNIDVLWYLSVCYIYLCEVNFLRALLKVLKLGVRGASHWRSDSVEWEGVKGLKMKQLISCRTAKEGR